MSICLNFFIMRNRNYDNNYMVIDHTVFVKLMFFCNVSAIIVFKKNNYKLLFFIEKF
jgi:hypothetical protein